ncbi:MAG: signal recognition particle-docking protein FtsY [Alphaproteobacteria bacterium]|nr:signal recognition particle-docking protein FtsY [Alphaproteobacteria bacterium]
MAAEPSTSRRSCSIRRGRPGRWWWRPSSVPPPAACGAGCSVSDPGRGRPGWLARLQAGLSRTASVLGDGIADLMIRRRLDRETVEGLEELLIGADLGVAAAGTIVGKVAIGRFDKDVAADDIRGALAEEIAAVLTPVAKPFAIDRSHKPHVVLVTGVNGTGKTTTIGKLAHQLHSQELSVMLAAGDTFRAAAIDQLKIWGERSHAAVFAREQGADAASLAFDALVAARAAAVDVLIIDTAGRLQNRTELMAELSKIVRVLRKQEAGVPHEVLLVLDATTGQNAISQVDLFREACQVTGLVMTKLDGTAKGGILVALAARFGIPIVAIGVGEGIDDLQPFEARPFAHALVGLGDFSAGA